MNATMNDETRFRSLFAETYQVITRYARHRGVTGADLDDLVAATYEVAWRRFDRVPADDGAVPWLITVAHNHLRNHRRRIKRDQGLLERLPAPEPSRGHDCADDGRWREVRHALGTLPAADRELVLLIAWDELTAAQAATVLGISPAAVRTRLHRARRRLAAALDAADPDSSRPEDGHPVRSTPLRSTQ